MGEYIKERRLALSMSQEDLAESAGTSAAYLSQIERGKVALPGADLRRRLARVLGVRHIDLIVAAGELAPDEVPGPSLPARNPSDPVERLCDLVRQIDLTIDRRQETLEAMLQMLRDQDRADGLLTEWVSVERRATG